MTISYSKRVLQRRAEERNFRKITYPSIPISIVAIAICTKLTMQERSLIEDIRKTPQGQELDSLVEARRDLNRIKNRVREDFSDSCNQVHRNCLEMDTRGMETQTKRRIEDICQDISNSCENSGYNIDRTNQKIQIALDEIDQRSRQITNQNPALHRLEEKANRLHQKISMIGSISSVFLFLALIGMLEIKERIEMKKESKD